MERENRLLFQDCVSKMLLYSKDTCGVLQTELWNSLSLKDFAVFLQPLLITNTLQFVFPGRCSFLMQGT